MDSNSDTLNLVPLLQEDQADDWEAFADPILKIYK